MRNLVRFRRRKNIKQVEPIRPCDLRARFSVLKTHGIEIARGGRDVRAAPVAMHVVYEFMRLCCLSRKFII